MIQHIGKLTCTHCYGPTHRKTYLYALLWSNTEENLLVRSVIESMRAVFLGYPSEPDLHVVCLSKLFKYGMLMF